jgi:hypothetical protein
MGEPEPGSGVQQLDMDRAADNAHRPTQLDRAERDRLAIDRGQRGRTVGGWLDHQRAADDFVLELRRPGVGVAGVGADQMAAGQRIGGIELSRLGLRPNGDARPSSEDVPADLVAIADQIKELFDRARLQLRDRLLVPSRAAQSS